MSENLFDKVYTPDVLSCLANLSNDEVFTPPDVVNRMLDMLPQELFENPDITFLDPACKTGVFLREIAKRLIKGLEPQIPDLQERLNHIFQKQLYGIAITELTSLLSRRGVYCSKYPNSRFSITNFDNADGNIRYKRVEHTWKDGKCVFCGASQEQYSRGDERETYAYEMIHTVNPEEIFNMKFDVIIGNPPYHLETGGSGKQAKPIYNLFVEQSKKLRPKYITMVTPSRWFAGGMGMDSFRNSMLSDGHIRIIVDFPNAKDCFSGLSIGGGVSYFLWDRDNKGDCKFTTFMDGKYDTLIRPLNEFPTLVRYNKAISIIHKISRISSGKLSDKVSSISPFGLSTKTRGVPEANHSNSIKLYSSDGYNYLSRSSIEKGLEYIDVFKVMISQTGAEHAGEPSKDGKYRVLTSTMKVIAPQEVCTHSYLIIAPCRDKTEAENIYGYLKTKFVRFLLLQAMTSIHITKSTFSFVPMQDFNKSWTDEVLYAKYGLTQDEIDFIESMIKPMEIE